jgi:ABC-type multidrug transport system fused ATPase/permease subunit
MMLSDTLPDLVTKRTSRTAASRELHGAIDVEGLGFSYQMRPEHQVLHDINLHIPAGTTCAFVGRSGGGKSTLVHLLLRFYDAKAGCIRYDGVPIDEWDLSVLRRQIASVAQDSQLFATSVIENITYGMRADEYSREDVIKAAKAANGQTDKAELSVAKQSARPAPAAHSCLRLSLAVCSLRLHHGNGRGLRHESW